MTAPSSDLALDTALNTARLPLHARGVLKLLQGFTHGTLELALPDGQRALFGRGAPHAQMTLANWKVIGAAVKSGDIGFAESFVAGDWASTDPARVLQVFIRNRAAAERVVYGSLWGTLLHRATHLLNRNTKRQAKKNIHAHYDLGNDFYALWLDPTMTYSAALFPQAQVDPHAPATGEELVAAQHAKYARVLTELHLAPGSRVLEIGCGWGGMAEAAARAGHSLTGLTLSREQLAWARERLARQGLAADLRLQDYRDEHGVYDGVASIEMFEAVGEQYWDEYFALLARVLTPGGRACIQTIEIADALFDRYRRGTDFIQQYIFPGGVLPCPSEFARRAERAGLRIERRHGFGLHYAKTLATWRAGFARESAAVRALGFDERFMRLWTFYLAYCEAAFAEENTDVAQYTLVRP